MSHWFDGCYTDEMIKARFRELAKKHHPDVGGKEETMKEINAEYTALMKGATTPTSHPTNAQDVYSAFRVDIHFDFDPSNVFHDLFEEILRQSQSREYRQAVEEILRRYANE